MGAGNDGDRGRRRSVRSYCSEPSSGHAAARRGKLGELSPALPLRSIRRRLAALRRLRCSLLWDDSRRPRRCGVAGRLSVRVSRGLRTRLRYRAAGDHPRRRRHQRRAARRSLPRRILRGARLPNRGGQAFRPGHVALVSGERRRWSSSLPALAIGIAEMIGSADRRSHDPGRGRRTARRDDVRLLRLAAIGYGVLMLGLMNCQLLFFLSRPHVPLWASVAGLASCLAGSASVVVLRLPAVDCVFALNAGIVVFALITTVAAARHRRKLHLRLLRSVLGLAQ